MPSSKQSDISAAQYTNNSSSNSLKALIEKITEENVQNGTASNDVRRQQVLDFLKTLPSKNYGDATLNENSAAIFGNVYQFYDSQNSEQKSILQDMQKSVQELCQKQDHRDSEIVHVHNLLKQFKATASTSEPERQVEKLDQLIKIKPDRQPEVVLQECLSIAIARQFTPDLCVDTISYFAQLDEWLKTRGSAVLLVQGGTIVEDASRDLAVTLTQSLKESAHPVAWYFPYEPSQRSYGMEQLLRSLIYQLVRLTPNLVMNELSQGRLSEPLSEISLEELAALFHRASTQVPRCFLIVEIPTGQSSNTLDQLIDIFASVVREAQLQRRALKVLLAYHDSMTKSTHSMTDLKVQECTLLATPMPLSRARQQSMRMNNDLVSMLTNVILTAD